MAADSPRQAPAASASAPVAPSLETELTCSICTDLLYQPLTLLDCLHTFCGACLKEWFHFQAQRVELSPDPPPPPDVPIFTCPSCRERVRDTRHDARVASLLDVFLALNPGRGRSEEEKKDMDARYKRGDKILPRIKRLEGRSLEERRRDEEERAMIEEARRVSLREAQERAAAAAGGTSSGRSSRYEREGDSRRRTTSAARSSTTATTAGSGERRRRRSESRQGRPAGVEMAVPSQQRQQQLEVAGRQRQIEHQSSLRSLISAGGMDQRDIEREIEEFARQIQEEGLLDGLDLDNLDLENNDELSRKITEAYRRRQRERRREGGRRNTPSAHSHRSEVSTTRPRSRATEDSSRPTSRGQPYPPSSNSRAPSASGSGSEDQQPRGRYPPSSSAHLEVQDAARRRRASSASRSATLPVVPTQTDLARDARAGPRAATDLSVRGSTGADSLASRRLSVGIDPRTSAAAAATAASSTITGTGSATLPLRTSIDRDRDRDHSRSASRPPPRPDFRPESPTLGISPSIVNPQQQQPSPPRRPPTLPVPPRYKEPVISCRRCAREHIEYTLHYRCPQCSGGDWHICLDCWRRGRNCCEGWFGFGKGAWARWEKRRREGGGGGGGGGGGEVVRGGPHFLVPQRFLSPPKPGPGVVVSSPLERLQVGAFCAACLNWAGDCYWKCEVCNEGEWGFCSECVGRGRTCSHPLLPLVYRPPTAAAGLVASPTSTTAGGGGGGLLPSPMPASPVGAGSSNNSPGNNSPTTATAPIPAAMGTFHPLPLIPPHCQLCRHPISAQQSHYHCPSCPSPPGQDHQSTTTTSGGAGTTATSTSTGSGSTTTVAAATVPPGYDICAPCYNGLVAQGRVAHENGPAGWRRCPRAGHRMVVVGYVGSPAAFFVQGADGKPVAAGAVGAGAGTGGVYLRRKIERDLVGGRRLRVEDLEGGSSHFAGGQWMIASWRDDSVPSPGGSVPPSTARRLQRLYSRDVGLSAAPGSAITTSTASTASSSSSSSTAAGNMMKGIWTDTFPPDGGTGWRVAAGWGWIPEQGVDDELMFPKGAEIVEVEDVNGEWFHGYYLGVCGLFPAPYVRVVGGR